MNNTATGVLASYAAARAAGRPGIGRFGGSNSLPLAGEDHYDSKPSNHVIPLWKANIEHTQPAVQIEGMRQSQWLSAAHT